MDNTHELRHLNVYTEPHQYPVYPVWRRLNTSKLETLNVTHHLRSDEDSNAYPDCTNLRSLTITFYDAAEFEGLPEEWPRFKSLAGLRELTVIYKPSEDFSEVDDRLNHLAAWLGRIDPFMGKLECLNIEFQTRYPDSIVDSEIEGLEELDAQLACLQSTTLKKVLIVVCHEFPDESTEPFGAVEGEGRLEEGEGHLSRQELREARTAGSLNIIWDALTASRARAPDFISVKFFRVEDTSWFYSLDQE
ncbi:hypothetical protein H0H92_009419 [Tricholoma furcatifolium]|nr:hypothetical protein H0H92_009419 [Tricholoma furcatifolium]